MYEKKPSFWVCCSFMETVTKLANKSVSQKHTREIHYKIPRLFNAPEREQLYEVHGANKFLKLGIAAFGLDALVVDDDGVGKT